jgi:hypothetical protein
LRDLSGAVFGQPRWTGVNYAAHQAVPQLRFHDCRCPRRRGLLQVRQRGSHHREAGQQDQQPGDVVKVGAAQENSADGYGERHGLSQHTRCDGKPDHHAQQ